MLHIEAGLVDIVRRHKLQSATNGILHCLDFGRRVAVLARGCGVVLVVYSAGLLSQRLRVLYEGKMEDGRWDV
jgi:hypothetical protein